MSKTEDDLVEAAPDAGHDEDVPQQPAPSVFPSPSPDQQVATPNGTRRRTNGEATAFDPGVVVVPLGGRGADTPVPPVDPAGDVAPPGLHDLPVAVGLVGAATDGLTRPVSDLVDTTAADAAIHDAAAPDAAALDTATADAAIHDAAAPDAAALDAATSDGTIHEGADDLVGEPGAGAELELVADDVDEATGGVDTEIAADDDVHAPDGQLADGRSDGLEVDDHVDAKQSDDVLELLRHGTVDGPTVRHHPHDDTQTLRRPTRRAPDYDPAPNPIPAPLPRLLSRKPRVRKVSRIVRHVDPWSVFKVALVAHLVLYVILLTSGVLLWNVATATGTVDNVERFLESFGWSSFEFDGAEIYRQAWIGGLFAVVGLTGLAVLTATLFNLITDLVGGVRFTVLEEEVVERRTSSMRRFVIRRPEPVVPAPVDPNEGGALREVVVDDSGVNPPHPR